MSELRLIKVTKYYHSFCALNSIDLTLTPGVYGLLGANGAGKSTLLKSLVGVHQISSGSILFNNLEINDDYLENVGYLPQNPMLYPNYTANEFLYYICIIKGIDKHVIDNTIKELLRLVNLENESKKIGQFSGGMRQRLGIAQALVGNPKILILDEPTAGLDPLERLRFRNILSGLSTDKIIVLATHIVSDIQNIAKEIIILKNGSVICKETPARLQEIVSPFVWSINNLTLQEYELINTSSLISNIKVMGRMVDLRVFAKSKPHSSAIPALAGLEDVYLYFFGDSK